MTLVPSDSNCPLDQVAGALADRHHRRDRRDADDDAQHRQAPRSLFFAKARRATRSVRKRSITSVTQAPNLK